MPKIIYRDPETDQEMSLDVGDALPEVTVGRNPGNVLRVNNPSISRRHAKIVWEGGQCTLYDLDSSNGSYINGNRVRSQVLQDGDRMRIGEFPVDYVDVTDSATAEVSADMIEDVLSSSGAHHRNTHLGGFQADPEITGEDLDIIEIEPILDLNPASFDPIGGPPEPPGGSPALMGDSDPYAEPHVEEGGFAMGGSPEEGGFAMGGSPEEGGFAMGGSPEEGGFAMGGSPEEGGFAMGGSPEEGGFAMGSPEEGGFAMGGSSEDGGFAMGGSPEEGGFAMGAPEEGGFAMGSPEEGGFAMGGAQDGGFSIGGSPEDSGFGVDTSAEPGGFVLGGLESTREEPAFGVANPEFNDEIEAAFAAELSAASDAEIDLDTKSAAPHEIASGIAQSDRLGSPDLQDDFEIQPDLTVEESVESVAALLQRDAMKENRELTARVEELEAERDSVLAAASEGANAASQMQIDRLRKERDRLSEGRRTLMRQIAEIKGTLEKAPSIEAFEKSQLELESLKNDASQNTQDLIASQNEIETKDHEIVTLQAMIQELNESLNQAQTSLQGAEGLGDQLSDAQEAVNAAQGNLANANDEATQLTNQLESANTELETLDRLLGEREKEIQVLTEEVEAAAAQIEARALEFVEINEALDEAHANVGAMQAEISGLNIELASRPVAGEVVEIKKSLDKAELTIGSLTEERDGLLDARADLKRELGEIRETLDAVNVRYDKVGGEMDATRKERDTLKEERGAFARETDYLQSQRRKLQDEIKALKKETKAEKKDAKRKNQIFGELSKDLRKLVKENNSLTDHLESARSQLDGAPTNDQVTSLQEEVTSLKGDATTLEGRIEDLETDATGLTRDLGKYAEEKEALAQEAAALREQVETLTSASADSEEQAKAVQSLTDERDEAVASLEAAQTEVGQLTADFENTKGSLEEMTQRVEDSSREDEFKALEAKLIEAETTLSALILENDQLNDEIKKLKK